MGFYSEILISVFQEVVIYRDGKHLTLSGVFQSLNLSAYDLSIDTLDMHVSVAFMLKPSFMKQIIDVEKLTSLCLIGTQRLLP